MSFTNNQRAISGTKEQALAEGLFQAAQLVEQFLQQRVTPIITANTTPTDREDTVKGLYLRALAWMATIKDLNSPLHFQAIVAANRALFELVVDLVLLHHDHTSESATRMLAWERSGKLKAALCLVRHFANMGKQVPAQYKALDTFATENRVAIEAERTKHWHSTKHPERWTGRLLSEDAKQADALEHLGLEEFYESEYRRICWYVHGSGLAAVRGLPSDTFHMVAGCAYNNCSRFAMDCAKLTLEDFGFWSSDARIRSDHENTQLGCNKLILNAVQRWQERQDHG